MKTIVLEPIINQYPQPEPIEVEATPAETETPHVPAPVQEYSTAKTHYHCVALIFAKNKAIDLIEDIYYTSEYWARAWAEDIASKYKHLKYMIAVRRIGEDSFLMINN